MRLGTVGMCILIIFLSWLQDAIPRYNKKFWSRGKVKITEYRHFSWRPLEKERRCEIGFTLGRDRFQRKCQDIDECSEYRGFCKGNVHCTNTVGSYICGCRDGYRTGGFYDTDCIDINECRNPDQCPKGALCVNTEGSFTCQCKDGYGGRLCKDINECSLNKAKCDRNAFCQNSGLGVNLQRSFSVVVYIEHVNQP